MTRKALGKGLSALLRDTPAAATVEAPPPPRPPEPPRIAASSTGLQEILVADIRTSDFQPRSHFSDEAIEELADSIRAGGVLQPIIVRPAGAGYELVAGERRLRAARLAEMNRIPALVRILSDEQALELSLVENIQREDLNPIEQARAFDRLATEFALTQEEIAGRTGKDRTTVANLIRLLRLPSEVQTMVEEQKLSAGHARALLKLEDSPVILRVLANRMASKRVSVRQAEEMVDRRMPEAKKERPVGPPKDPNVKAAETAMELALGTKVRIIERRKGGGRVEIDYYSLEDLNRIYDIFVGKTAGRQD